ncbi:hypothetical protein E4N62_23130 [Streptomyces sp. MNU76]|uniref:hypothetical protein n=1 Tax=Streptomyces sp. MNU76 TaxID=2560026 RepID=UPI001E62980B|nr:hypothetical protein [Streptomyces sp. MNU76]MCC9707899.1 hypothetical protein [Streptomyces sp. MNU76]
MSLTNRHRVSVLHIDRDADLPLQYVYLPEKNAFRTLGYVRLRGVTVFDGVSHAGRDTDDQRDKFLLKVLTALLVPPREARRIVRTADHLSEQGSPSEAGPGTGLGVHEPYARGS